MNWGLNPEQAALVLDSLALGSIGIGTDEDDGHPGVAETQDHLCLGQSGAQGSQERMEVITCLSGAL